MTVRHGEHIFDTCREYRPRLSTARRWSAGIRSSSYVVSLRSGAKGWR